jgi:hypothetical protein
MTREQARSHIGRFVGYLPPGNNPRLAKAGEIASVGEDCVYVLYDGDKHPKATYAPHLTLLAMGGGDHA